MPTFHDKLLQAIRLGLEPDVQRWLSAAGFDAPTLGRWGRALRRWRHRRTLNTALQAAAEVGHLPSIERLLPLAHPRSTDGHGRTPFLLATMYGHEAVADRLLPVSDVHRAAHDHVPPVVFAAKAGLVRTVNRLIPLHQTPAHRARLNDALAAAAERGQRAVVRALLPHADAPTTVAPPNPPGKTPLMLAAEYGHLGCVDELLPRSDPQAADHQGMNALMYATAGRHGAVVERLVPCTDPRAARNNGQTALHLAAAHRDLRSLIALLPGSDPNRRDQEGWTPLMHAAASTLDAGSAVPVLERLLTVSNPALRNGLDQSAFDLALNLALQWRRPWHVDHWSRVDVLMFHEPDAQRREQAWQDGGAGHLPRWAAHRERQELAALLHDETVPTLDGSTVLATRKPAESPRRRL